MSFNFVIFVFDFFEYEEGMRRAPSWLGEGRRGAESQKKEKEEEPKEKRKEGAVPSKPTREEQERRGTKNPKIQKAH